MTSPSAIPPWTSLKLIHWTSDFFKKKGIPDPRLDAELLLAHVLKCKRIDLYTHFEKAVSEKDLAHFKKLIERRIEREPLQYIIGETEFWGLKMAVTPDVLIPRPETELLVEEALKTVGADPRVRPNEERSRAAITCILDIGTGSGCIAITLAKNLPQSTVTATDNSLTALDIAKKNAQMNGVAERIEFLPADIASWRAFKAEGRFFDMIVSNPPYIPSHEIDELQPEVSQFEPRQALDGGKDGLDLIRKITAESVEFMKPGGRLLIEIGEGQVPLIQDFVKDHAPSFHISHIVKDYSGIERIVVLNQ